MSGSTTDDQPPPTPTATPDMLAQALQLAQQSGLMPQMPARDTTPVSRSTISLLGEALAGGPPAPGMTSTEQEAAGRHALMSFGTSLMGASGVHPGVGLSARLAQGFQGAQAGETGYEQMSMAQLGAQQQWAQQQAQNRVEAIKAALPFLRLQAAQGIPNPLAGGGAPAGPNASISAAAGQPLTGDIDKDRVIIAQRESGGDPTALNYVARSDPSAYARGATASGKYQFVNSTWQEGMKLAGLDPSKYATAMSAPEAVQDQVFNAVYKKYGTAPWDASKFKQQWVPTPTGQMVLANVVPGGKQAAPAATATTTPPAAPAPYKVASVGPIPPPPSGAPTAPASVAPSTGIVSPGELPGAGSGTAGPPASTTTPPAQPAPQSTTQAQQPPTPAPITTPPAGGPLTFEQFQQQHPIKIDPSTYAVTPPDLTAAIAAKNAASQTLDLIHKGLSTADPNKATQAYTDASNNVAKLQQEAQSKSLELQQAAQKNALDTQRQLYNDEMTRQQQAKLKADELAQTVAENEKNRQADIRKAELTAGMSWRQKMAEDDAKAGNDQLAQLDTAAAGSANMQSILALVGPTMKNLPTGLVAQTLSNHPEMVNYLRAAGFLSGDTADATQLLQGLTAFMATEMKPKGLGPLRVQEMNAFQGSLPTLLQSEEGRQKAFAFINAYSQRIQQEADFAHNYFKRSVANDQPDAKPGSIMPARNLDGLWNAMGKTTEEGGLGSVLPMWTGGTSTAQDAANYQAWQQQQQAKPGNAYWQLQKNPKTGQREMHLSITPPPGG